jgi:hypothetical protein
MVYRRNLRNSFSVTRRSLSTSMLWKTVSNSLRCPCDPCKSCRPSAPAPTPGWQRVAEIGGGVIGTCSSLTWEGRPSACCIPSSSRRAYHRQPFKTRTPICH